ncbi:hypothetical protein CTZ27_07850 [Streptomyces griseocarneus]|nr:hypothetical protein CTZ27_07850 [Streptomyces griseocarneus]
MGLLHWPDGDPKKLRKAAKAWNDFADAVEKIRTPVNNTAQALIHHNKGESIDAFETFWARYAGKGDKGWLHEIPKAAREMAKALENLAKAIDDAVDKLWAELGIEAAVILAGVGAAWFTFGLSTAASATAAAAVVEVGTAVGVTISAVAAEVVATTLVTAAFAGVESVAVDLAVAQPMKISAGLQHGGISLEEVNQAAKDGMLYGGLFGGLGSAARNYVELGSAAFRNPLLRNSRPLIGEEATAARRTEGIECAEDPIDVTTGTMLLPQTDVTLPADLPLVLERTHLSSYRAGSWFGTTWASTLDERVQLDAEGVVFAAADGMRLVYPVPRPSEPTLPVRGPRWPLTWDGRPDGLMTVTDPYTGVVRTFGGLTPTDTPGVVQLPLISCHDRNDARIDIERTANSTPTAVRHSGGYHIAVDTENARVTALRLLEEPPSPYEREREPGRGHVLVRYGYDEAGNLTEVVNSSGKPLRFTYDDQDRITTWTDRNGMSYAYTYDARGRVVRTEGTGRHLSGELVYDDETRTTTVIDSLGHSRTYRHDGDGQVIEQTDQLGNATVTRWTPRGDQRLSVTDPLGRTTRYIYDEQGNLTGVTLPDGTSGHAAYDERCRPTEVTEPGGASWRHTYDDRGNLLTTVDPLGAETRYAYDELGHVTSVTDALGGITRVDCSPAGLPLTITDPLGHSTTARRDAFGRITEAVDPLGHTVRMGWTTEGKPSWREHPDGTRESWTWDGEGNLVTHTDPAGNTTSHTVGAFDLPATRTDPDGTTYAFAYDTELRLTEVTNPQGLTWTYTYDPAGRLTAEKDFNGRELTYEVDAAGELLSRTNGAGETLHFVRDALGRVVEQGEATFAYDASGALLRATNPDAEIAYERDALGRVVSETVNGRTTTYAYDALGRRTSRVTPSGLATEWTYDAAGRPVELRGDAGALAFVYDAAGRETSRRLGEEGALLTQEWDAQDRLITQVLTGDADRLLQHRTHAYRADGYLTEIRELTSGTRRFDVEPTGRVTKVSAHGWTETYAYDTAGNLTYAKAPAHEAPGQREFDGTLIRRAGRTTYTHDAQGRLTRRTRKLLNGKTRTWTYAWNAEDRLMEAVTPEGERWHYAYDALGRRISKRSEPAGETVFSWDGTRLSEELRPTGEATTWDYAPGTHRPLTQTTHTPPPESPGKSLIEDFSTPPATFHAIVTDAVGTPTELLTLTGELVWQHRTSLWGTPLPSPPEGGADCPLRFPGQYVDAETGLNYNFFRYYDPEAASYLAPDPLGLEPAPNHHAYVKNPCTTADPMGLSPEECLKRAKGSGSHNDDAPPPPRPARDMLNPESMRGASVDEVMEMAQGDGWIREVSPSATGGGYVLRKGQPTILIEFGDPAMRRLDHQGPYLKYQMGKKPIRIPLEGNPALGD